MLTFINTGCIVIGGAVMFIVGYKGTKCILEHDNRVEFDGFLDDSDLLDDAEDSEE